MTMHYSRTRLHGTKLPAWLALNHPCKTTSGLLQKHTRWEIGSLFSQPRYCPSKMKRHGLGSILYHVLIHYKVPSVLTCVVETYPSHAWQYETAKKLLHAALHHKQPIPQLLKFRSNQTHNPWLAAWEKPSHFEDGSSILTLPQTL